MTKHNLYRTEAEMQKALESMRKICSIHVKKIRELIKENEKLNRELKYAQNDLKYLKNQMTKERIKKRMC